ncbi:hypothetical protein D3C76_810370 [compost metagenome]
MRSSNGDARAPFPGLTTAPSESPPIGRRHPRQPEEHPGKVSRTPRQSALGRAWNLELQRDWARGETYNETVQTSIAHGGAYGLGLIYAKTMFNASEGH